MTEIDHEARLRTLFDAAEDGIVAAAEDGTVHSLNPAAERIFGWRSAEIAGQNVSMLISDPQRRAADDEPARNVVGLRKGGERLDLHLEISHYQVGEQRISVLAVRELGAWRAAERERAILREQLHHAQKMEALAMLAGGIAHDIGNIVNCIMACADHALALLPAESPAAREVGEIAAASLRAADVVHRITTFCQGNGEPSQAFCAGQVVWEVSGLLRASLPGNIGLDFAMDDGPITVVANPTALYQVVMNLCMNARQAIGEADGLIGVQVRRLELDGAAAQAFPVDPAFPVRRIVGLGRPGRYARIAVEDNGAGMTEHTLARLFQPFFTTKGVGKGSGLGLSAVHGIVSGLDGGIAVETALGRGSRFNILLPLA